MKRRHLVLGSLLISWLLTGCSYQNNFLEDMAEETIMQVAGISDNEDYQKYQELQKKGELNEEGAYNELDKEEYKAIKLEAKKQVRVTMASNSFLNITYYYDAGLTQKVIDKAIYMDPGEKLYCSQPECENEYSNAYAFSGFRVYEFDADGKKGKLLTTTGEDSLVLEIPEDYEGTELSVIPMGVYEKRGLTFSAYYYDENDVRMSAAGDWSVNDEAVNGNTADVGASDTYTVKYKYDSNLYYYVSADPVPYNSESKGTVEFRTATALNNTDTYSVQLHKLITAAFSYDNTGKKGIAGIKINGTELKDFDNKELKGLKAGDKLVITTNDNYRLFCSGMTVNNPETVEGGFRYTFTIPESNASEYVFKVSKSELKVILDNNIGYDMAFDIIAAGVCEKNCYYSKQKLDADLTIFDDTIGVEEKVIIAARDAEIKDGYAIKAEIKKKDGNGQETSEIQYITSTPGTVEINLYNGSGEVTNLNKIYENITVNISLAEVTTYTSKTISNGTIKVKLVDCTSAELLSEGDAVEDFRKVELTIVPKKGYYITGKNVANNIYTDIMKFSKFEKDIDSIISKHEIKRVYSVTLDSRDAYGTVVYKLNGEEVSGNVTIREEDELKIEYRLNDSDYKIVREADGFWDGINTWKKNTFSKNDEVMTIPLTDDIDGKTINRSEYIEVTAK